MEGVEEGFRGLLERDAALVEVCEGFIGIPGESKALKLMGNFHSPSSLLPRLTIWSSAASEASPLQRRVRRPQRKRSESQAEALRFGRACWGRTTRLTARRMGRLEPF